MVVHDGGEGARHKAFYNTVSMPCTVTAGYRFADSTDVGKRLPQTYGGYRQNFAKYVSAGALAVD